MEMLINKQSLAEQVAIKIRERVSLGHYKTNDRLPIEPELMKMFGVGRSTIREAIKILANSGLLRVQQGLGTFIADVTGGKEPFDQRLKRAKNHDLNEIRELLELKIAAKAAICRSESDIVKMQQYLNDRKTAANVGLIEACIEADISFHIAIAEASKNEILADLFRSVSIHLKNWFLEGYADTTVFQETYSLHEQLLTHIINSDPEMAWQTASKIISHNNY